MEPIYIPGVVHGWSCPHCEAGVYINPETWDIGQCHNDRWCQTWRRVNHLHGANPLTSEVVYV